MQFDYSWGRIRTQTGAIDCRRLTHGLRDLSELVAVHVGVREGKVRMIEEIKEPSANGDVSTLPSRNGKGFFYVEVSVAQYADSPELRHWCGRNRNRVYIPEWLLKEWGLQVEEVVSGVA